MRVLEARERIGGRTHTDSSLGVDIDLGAAWIHGPHGNPLTPLAERYGIKHGYTDFNNDQGRSVLAFDQDGRRLDTAAYTRGGQAFRAALTAMSASLLYKSPPESVRSLADLHDYGLPGIDLDHLSADTRLGFSYAGIIRPQYEDAADLDEIDWRLARAYVKQPGGDLLLFGGGYRQLVDSLAADLEIETGCPVDHIAYDRIGVRVSTPLGTQEAAYAVVTVPLGVLKSGAITFDPPLSAGKAAAIERIGFGRYEKLALRFPRIFWPVEPHRINFLSDGESAALYNAWLNIAHYSGEPVLVSYHSGSRARRVNRMSDGELVDGCMRALRTMFGPAVPEPIQYVRSGWEADPYARGSYSFPRVGQDEHDRICLGEPVGGRLYFAGEAVHPHYWGTVHGAYETGLVAARQIQEKGVHGPA